MASEEKFHFNYSLASGNLCRLLLTFANSLDPDHNRPNVSHDLDQNCLTHTLDKIFEYVDFEKKSADDDKSMKITQHASS